MTATILPFRRKGEDPVLGLWRQFRAALASPAGKRSAIIQELFADYRLRTGGRDGVDDLRALRGMRR
jgi:hypothetical protein